MPGFVVDTDSLIDVANSLDTLHHVLNTLAGGHAAFSDADLGGHVVGQQVTDFNIEWNYGVVAISGEVSDLKIALLEAAAHYEKSDQSAVGGPHAMPKGPGPVIGPHQPATHQHHPAHHHKHEHTHHDKHDHKHDHHKHEPKKHEQGTGTGTTTIGGARPPITGTGTGTTTIGGGRGGRSGDGEHHHHKEDSGTGTGTGTTTIGPHGTSTTVHTGPGRGYGTTTIGPDHAGGAAPHSLTVHSDLLTSHQARFVSTLSALTGLKPRVAAAWCLSEQSGSHAAACQARNDNNWLNIDSGSDPSAWRDPTSAAMHTARFLRGEWGGASHSIQGIVGHGDQPATHQLAAISASGWTSDHVSGGHLLHESYGQLSGLSVTEH